MNISSRPLQKPKHSARSSHGAAKYDSCPYDPLFLTSVTQVYAAGSEDMDTLTFNAPILLRHLTFSEARKQPISEINLARALEGLEMNMSQVRRSFPSVLFCTHRLPSLSTCVFCSAVITSSPSGA